MVRIERDCTVTMNILILLKPAVSVNLTITFMSPTRHVKMAYSNRIHRLTTD